MAIWQVSSPAMVDNGKFHVYFLCIDDKEVLPTAGKSEHTLNRGLSVGCTKRRDERAPSGFKVRNR